jgi:hypothetical protein
MNKCKCGDCDESTDGDFVPGHDQKLRIRLEQEVGGLLSLEHLIYECNRYATGNASESEVLGTIRHAFTQKTKT